MRKYNIIISDSAKRIIRKNYDYIAGTYDNETAALVHTIDIYEKIKSLETFPKIHAIYEGRDDMEYRIARVRHYQIFYRVDDEAKAVYVEYVFHSHQNPESLELD